jgi:hypothetical protein
MNCVADSTVAQVGKHIVGGTSEEVPMSAADLTTGNQGCVGLDLPWPVLVSPTFPERIFGTAP